MPARFTGAVTLFDEDPDLLGRLDPDEAAEARARAIAPAAVLRAGDGEPWVFNGDWDGHLGVLVLDGLMTRNTTLMGRTTMEIVGARDLVRPWADAGDGASVPQEVTWTVHLPTRVALLDQRFAERVAPWPEITRTLIGRGVARAQRLSHHLAILENPRVDARLLLLFWHLADGWGRVGPDGVTVPLHLTHKTLGRLIRAQRPSVTAALHALAERGLLTRRASDGAWQLHGDPGHQLDALLRSGSRELPGRLPTLRAGA
jgi:CRP/FNR family transcriptional regulator, cyclic AMP receptor protein